MSRRSGARNKQTVVQPNTHKNNDKKNTSLHAGRPKDRHAVLDAVGPVGDLREVVLAHHLPASSIRSWTDGGGQVNERKGTGDMIRQHSQVHFQTRHTWHLSPLHTHTHARARALSVPFARGRRCSCRWRWSGGCRPGAPSTAPPGGPSGGTAATSRGRRQCPSPRSSTPSRRWSGGRPAPRQTPAGLRTAPARSRRPCPSTTRAQCTPAC